MGQRSQIYVSFEGKEKRKLYARHLQWNYGDLMVSRTRSILEWLEEHKQFDWVVDERLPRIIEVNFDKRDVQDSYNEMECFDKGTSLREMAEGADNNDGQLFIKVANGEIKYCLIYYYDYNEEEERWELDYNTPMTVSEYIDYYGLTPEQEVKTKVFENKLAIQTHFKLMTKEELEEMLDAKYDDWNK